MIKKNILFLCTGNSCRSQMAEGWLRHLKGNQFNVFSAGIETHGLNPNVIKVMAEDEVDNLGHLSKLMVSQLFKVTRITAFRTAFEPAALWILAFAGKTILLEDSHALSEYYLL